MNRDKAQNDLQQDRLQEIAKFDAIFVIQSTRRETQAPHESGISKQIKKSKRLKQTGISYDTLKPYYQYEEYCPNCGNSLGLVEGEVKGKELEGEKNEKET